MVGDECCHVKELFFSNTKKILQEYKDNQLMKTSREIIAVLGTKEEYKCIRLQLQFRAQFTLEISQCTG